MLIGDDASLDEPVRELISVAGEQGFSIYRASGRIFRGWIKTKNGNVIEGISLLRRGSKAYHTTGARACVPHNIALLATACEVAGQIEERVWR